VRSRRSLQARGMLSMNRAWENDAEDEYEGERVSSESDEEFVIGRWMYGVNFQKETSSRPDIGGLQCKFCCHPKGGKWPWEAHANVRTSE